VKKIYVIIPKFNGEKEIRECLKSLQLIKLPENWEMRTEVVDNNKKNLGFAGGVNVGIKDALKNGAEAVLLLNQDTLVKKDFLGPLLENQAEIVSPVIKFKREGKWVYDFGGRINWWLGRATHAEFSNYQIAKLPIIDYLSGCAMLIRRPVFEKIGLLDERYFLYFEDADFCLRAKKAGFRIAVEPRSVILHKLSPTTKKPLWQNLHLLRSNLIFINRWIFWCRRPIAWFYWFFLCLKILFFS